MKNLLGSSFARLVLVLAIVVAALSAVGGAGALLSASGSCTGWPLCNPTAPLGWLVYLHRALGGIAAVLMLTVFRKAWREQRRQLVILPITTLLTVLYFGQVFIGALEATQPQRSDLAALHGFTAVSLWIALGGLLAACAVLPHEAAPAPSVQWRQRAKDFLALTKPVIVGLLLATTFAGLVAGYKGWPPFWLAFWTLLGGALAAGGSSALNQYIDRDLDRNMQRTARRPLPSGRLLPPEGLAFGLGLCLASYYLLAGLVNLLAALLSLAGIFYYVILYSLWLKKATTQNIVIGGGAGAIPPLVGWAAATNHLGLAALILFGIIFLWTPPHFWALAIVRKNDYERAGVPMLPVVQGEEETRRQILIYTLLLVGVSLLLPLWHMAGVLYLFSAIGLGMGLLYAGWRVWRVPGNKVAYFMYRWSSIYLLLIFAALMLDAVIRL